MNIKKLSHSVMIVLFVSLPATTASAQQSAKPETITAPKRALLKELFDLTKLDKLMGNMIDAFLLQTQKDMPVLVEQITGDTATDAKNQEENSKKIVESSRRVSERIRELLPQRINYAEVAELLFYPLYDKFFSEEDLKQIVAFYRSPAGQKSIEVVPQLLQESMQRSSEILLPKLTPIINQALEEEKQRVLKDSKKPNDK